MAEDLGAFGQVEYLRRRDERNARIIAMGMPFIYDASIDREWPKLESILVRQEYGHFVISLDLGRDMLGRLYLAKGYSEGFRLDERMAEHQAFLEACVDKVNLHIGEAKFPRRLELGLQAVNAWLNLLGD